MAALMPAILPQSKNEKKNSVNYQEQEKGLHKYC